jgi:hypothetical protein
VITPLAGHKSKSIATWLALVGGSLGLHRFYLHGLSDAWGWCCWPPTLLGLYGLQRARHLGLDDHLSWLLLPLLGLMLAAGMLAAIVYGLMPDEKWDGRYNGNAPGPRSDWLTIVGVLLALALGAVALMSTIAFSAQRFFEYQAESTTKHTP